MPRSSKPSKLATAIVNAPRVHDNDYPLWAGPCDKGPLGGITQSMLGRFLVCREQFRLRYICGLEPSEKWSHRFGYGNMWHVCEEAFAGADRNADPNIVADLGLWQTCLLDYAQQQCRKYPLQQEEIGKWYNVCKVQFPEYIRYWSEHPDVKNRKPLLQEQVFDVSYRLPSGRTVRLRGRWDSVDLIDDGIYLQENKTKGDIDKQQIERQLSFDLQTMMYLIALDREGYEDAQDSEIAYKIGTKPILGVRYNVIRRPLSGGKGSIRPHQAKSTKNKFTPAESEEEFYERLRRDYIAAEPDYWFFRVRGEISAKDIEVFQKTCLDPVLEQLCDWYEEVIKEDWRRDDRQYRTSMHYRMPYGVYNSLTDGGATEYDAYLATGSEAGLRRTEELFTELK